MLATLPGTQGVIPQIDRHPVKPSARVFDCSRLGRLNPRTHSPNAALVLQGIWACFLTLTGTYTELLDYIIFAVLLFYMLTIGGLFILRVKQPGAERPYKAFGYPVLPALYLAMTLFVEICILIYKPRYTWPGLILVALGVPVYFLWRRSRTQPASP